MEKERAAAKHAAEVLGHQVVAAEEFGAKASSPQIACLAGIREADVVVLMLGPRYGAKQSGGVSATHEEVLEARNRKPLLVFVQSGVESEPEQAALMAEIGGWETGLYRDGYDSVEDLGPKVTRALHRFELAHATAPLDPAALRTRASRLFSQVERGYRQGGTTLEFALAVGPETSLLRPAEMESQALLDAMQQHALFGRPPLFNRSLGMRSDFSGEALVLSQGDRHSEAASVQLWPSGDMLIQLPIPPAAGGMGFGVVVEETVLGQLLAAVGYAAWMLARVDPTERLSHVVPAARLLGEHAGAWRTKAEHDASPNSGTIPWRQGEHQEPVFLGQAHQVRAALAMDGQRIVEDLVVLLRRRWNN